MKNFLLLFVLIPAVCVAKPKPIDRHALPQVEALYDQLASLKGKGMLFGHHCALTSGKEFEEWPAIENEPRCDVKTAVGDYPAIFSFDFGRGFSQNLPYVIKAGEMGGIVTISYHISNPMGEKTFYVIDKKRREVAGILPGGRNHAFLTAQLDSIADFAHKAVANGEKIPIIFRPWHEHTGAWFWWGISSCSEDEFNELWRFTVTYLRDKKDVHNFLYAFSPSHPQKNGYGYRNPGPDYYDIAGFDCYKEEDYAPDFIANAKVTVEYANKHDKIAACTEFGYKKGIQNSKNPKWHTEQFLEPLKNDPLACQMVFAVTWANKGQHRWVPLQGDLQYDDFVTFYHDPFMIFLEKWKNEQTKKQ